ncbi:MAG TPA: DUF2845 domain-containing protein, partial [Anaeromyxobacter sp.]|nr:DUF2845 domain-containing protein [Anaeromyxobacter sp.]
GLAAALLPAVAAADSLSCDGGIVSAGDSKLDLVGKCGWPTLQEDQLVERSASVLERRGFPSASRGVVARVERWTYDFGRSRFIQIAELEGGKVVRTERGGYGYGTASAVARPPIPRARCAQPVFHEGETSYEVLARCGDPAFREAAEELRTRAVMGEHGRVLTESVSVLVEVWTYDFGPAAFVRHLTFEDGRLLRVDTGSYGYAR